MSQIELYRHPLGPEMGRVELVIPSPEDSDDVVMICRSERGKDRGVIYPVSMDADDHQSMCQIQDIETAMGCVLESDRDELQLVEVPEDAPMAPPDRIAGSNVRSIRNENMWIHPWGRCCCVMQGGDLEPVTTERIHAGEVPWWGSPFTPYQHDLIAAVSDPDNCAMHVLEDAERLCGRCGHEVWVVMDEDVPDELPVEPQEEEFAEPILGRRDALDDVPWTSKMSAWTIFRKDSANKAIISQSKLPVAKADKRRAYSTEQAFERFNSCKERRGERNVYTVKQAFYAALGSGHNGVWSDLNLDLLRLVKGLEEVDIPAAILDEADLGEDEAEEVRERAYGRVVDAEGDEEADVLHDMLDEDDPEDDDFVEPGTRAQTSFTPKSKTNGKRPPERTQLIKAAQVLQRALSDFVQALHEDGG
jgi:hypothetical protein